MKHKICVLERALIKLILNRIDFVKLILIKIDFEVIQFIFRYFIIKSNQEKISV